MKGRQGGWKEGEEEARKKEERWKGGEEEGRRVKGS